MSKRVVLPIIFVVLGFFTEVIFQGFKKKIRPPPLWVNQYVPSSFSEGWNDTRSSSSSSSYFDGLPPAQEFKLSATDISFFRDNGYVVVRGAVSPDQVSLLKSASGSFGNATVPGPYSKFLNNPWRVQRGLLDFVSFGPVGHIASQLLSSSSVRLILDYLIQMDNDGAKGSPWHADMLHVTDDTPAVQFWIAMTNISSKSGGGITVAPGSHLWKGSDTSETDANPCFWRVDRTAEAYARLGPEAIKECEAKLDSMSVPLDINAGDAVVWSRWLMHKTVPFKEVDGGTEVPRLAYNVRVADGDKGVFQLPGFSCSGRPRWEWYQSWDTAVEGEVMKGAFMPQIWPRAIWGERETALKEMGVGMRRESFLKMVFEFAIYKPVMCAIPQKLGWRKEEHQHHRIDLYKVGGK